MGGWKESEIGFVVGGPLNWSVIFVEGRNRKGDLSQGKVWVHPFVSSARVAPGVASRRGGQRRLESWNQGGSPPIMADICRIWGYIERRLRHTTFITPPAPLSSFPPLHFPALKANFRARGGLDSGGVQLNKCKNKQPKWLSNLSGVERLT